MNIHCTRCKKKAETLFSGDICVACWAKQEYKADKLVSPPAWLLDFNPLPIHRRLVMFENVHLRMTRKTLRSELCKAYFTEKDGGTIVLLNEAKTILALLYYVHGIVFWTTIEVGKLTPVLVQSLELEKIERVIGKFLSPHGA